METFKIDSIANNLSAFNGFTEREMLQIHNNANILKLKPFETIFKEDVIDETLYILLSGAVKLYCIYKDQSIEVIISQKNSFVDLPAFNNTSKKTHSAIALEPSTVLAINEKTFEALPQQIKIGLLKNLSSSTANNSNSFILRLANTTDTMSKLSSYIKTFYNEKSDLCKKSELTQKMQLI